MKPTYEQYREQTLDSREGEWPRLEHSARQTGRTTRMMTAARAANYAGCRVHIVVLSLDFARELRRQYRTHEWTNSVFFHTPDSCPFDLHKRKEVEAKSYALTVFIDHSVFENHPIYSNVLLELHRFDLPPSKEKK